MLLVEKRLRIAWPCIPWEDHATRATLEEIFHEPLKKKHGACSVVVLDGDHETVLNVDAESNIGSTQNETGSDFPWKTTPAENCCAVATTAVFCTIL